MSQPYEHPDHAAGLRAVLEQERAAIHNAQARAERAETALKEALARVEELEALLYKRIQASYISENEYINKGAVYLRRIRKSCREALQHAGGGCSSMPLVCQIFVGWLVSDRRRHEHERSD